MKQRFWVPLVAVAMALLILVPTTFAVGEPGTTLYAQLGTNRFPAGQGAADASLTFNSERDVVLRISIAGPAGTNNGVRVYVDGTCADPGEWVINRTPTAGQNGPFLEVASNSGVNTIQVNQLDVEPHPQRARRQPQRDVRAHGGAPHQRPELPDVHAVPHDPVPAADHDHHSHHDVRHHDVRHHDVRHHDQRLPRTTTTTATTTSATTTGPAPLNYTPVGNSAPAGTATKLISDVAGSPTYGGLTFILPLPDIKFSDIDVLRMVAVPEAANDTCNGGSPRFSIYVDFHNGGSTEDAVVFVQAADRARQSALQATTPVTSPRPAAPATPPADTTTPRSGARSLGHTARPWPCSTRTPLGPIPDIQLLVDGGPSGQPDGRHAFTVTPTVIVSP